MSGSGQFEIFLVATPGLETALLAEVQSRRFRAVRSMAGGVAVRGLWPDVWRANLELRGATRVLARIGSFRVLHLAQLDKRARAFAWNKFLRPDVPLRVEAACAGSRIYHSGAAVQRIETALREELGATISEEAELCIKARIEEDLCTISIDTTGQSLHKRGYKKGIGKAPLRETLASLFLRQCGFDGNEPVVDPMCGSGTFVIEAAEIAAGLNPGRSRSFAFEKLVSFDPVAWQRLRGKPPAGPTAYRFHGSDRDAGAITHCRATARRAGVANWTNFQQRSISEVTPPDGPPGLVMVNPPYGLRLGNKKALYGLYGALGRVLTDRFGGWRFGLVTSEPSLAKATGIAFVQSGPPVSHGGIGVYLFRTGPL
jgi:putative N6-adenine-specific DNA methylase